ncbi:21449_t:CDS:2, partial [Gigaspora rosea]
DIIDFKNKNPNISNVDLAEWVKKEFNLEVHPTTIGRQIKKHGEDASVDDDVVADAIPKLREVLKGYDLKDIYNMDETGLFYR